MTDLENPLTLKTVEQHGCYHQIFFPNCFVTIVRPMIWPGGRGKNWGSCALDFPHLLVYFFTLNRLCTWLQCPPGI